MDDSEEVLLWKTDKFKEYEAPVKNLMSPTTVGRRRKFLFYAKNHYFLFWLATLM